MSAPMRVVTRQGFTWHCRRVAHQQSKAKYEVRVQQYCTSSDDLRSTPSDVASLQAATSSPSSVGAVTPREFFRTSEGSPGNHSLQHEGQFYSIPLDQLKSTLPVGTSTKWQKLVKPFQEASIMVRRPALEVINYLKAADYSNPPIKYLMYGRKGSGKTMSLCHVIHYCHSQGWTIVHVPCANLLNVKYKEDYQDSTTHKGMYDQPATAIEWLNHFKERNRQVLAELKTSNAIVWSKRECTEKGEPLIEVVNQGLKRPKNSCDAVSATLNELQLQSYSGAYRTLFAVKAVNGFFAEKSPIRKYGGYQIPVAELTLNMHFKKFLQGNWVNGAMVMTVDPQNFRFEPRDDFKPLYLLKKQGFEYLDPFVPVYVDNYSEKEMESCIEFYLHKKWIQNQQVQTEEGRKQLKFLTENNPGLLNMMSANL